MSSYFGANTYLTELQNTSPTDRYMAPGMTNQDPCAVNDPSLRHMQYAQHAQTPQGDFPRFPPFGRVDLRQINNSYYNNSGLQTMPDQNPAALSPNLPPNCRNSPPPQAYHAASMPSMQHQQYNTQQYTSCKMQQQCSPEEDNNMMSGPNHPMAVSDPVGQWGGNGSPNGQQTHQTSSVPPPSPLYPWMRSQFGKLINH